MSEAKRFLLALIATLAVVSILGGIGWAIYDSGYNKGVCEAQGGERVEIETKFVCVDKDTLKLIEERQ